MVSSVEGGSRRLEDLLEGTAGVLKGVGFVSTKKCSLLLLPFALPPFVETSALVVPLAVGVVAGSMLLALLRFRAAFAAFFELSCDVGSVSDSLRLGLVGGEATLTFFSDLVGTVGSVSSNLCFGLDDED